MTTHKKSTCPGEWNHRQARKLLHIERKENEYLTTLGELGKYCPKPYKTPSKNRKQFHRIRMVQPMQTSLDYMLGLLPVVTVSAGWCCGFWSCAYDIVQDGKDTVMHNTECDHTPCLVTRKKMVAK